MAVYKNIDRKTFAFKRLQLTMNEWIKERKIKLALITMLARKRCENSSASTIHCVYLWTKKKNENQIGRK
jgi:hypothetical protein